ncbi:hypothetical protein KY289_033610 [Solanum tuberosum]|nr:hypothetical protein KY289_033610 [Solanum tuberosum]
MTLWIGDNGILSVFSIVYAKTESKPREPLCDDLRRLANSINQPWCIFGDFNCITEASEKQGGRPQKAMPFINCIVDCDLIDMGYSGPIHTWCNDWASEKIIWKRLNRALYNNHIWATKFPNSSLVHLPRVDSDHAPLLINLHTAKVPSIKIKDQSGQWIEDEDQIAEEAVTFYENLFTENNHVKDIRSLDCIQSVISVQDNHHHTRMPDIAELEDIVFSFNPNSAPGPDEVTIMT